MRPPRTLTALAVALAATVPSTAHANAPARPARLQAALDGIIASGVPGAVALTRKNGDTGLQARGVRNLKTRAKIRPDDRFRIGSGTKTFVATVILQLVGEGRLRLKDDVGRRLPGEIVRGRKITVRHLLDHTSGLPDFSRDPRLLEPYDKDPAYYSPPRRLLSLVESEPLLFPPGTGFAYSNTNYVVLGLLIEKITGRSASAEIHRRLIRPLSLRGTSLPVRDARIRGPHTRGHLTNVPGEGTVDVTELSPSIAWTSGGMISTARDLARFQRALFSGRLLRPAQQRALKTIAAASDGYALGVARADTPCGTAWGHGGAFPGYHSLAYTTADGRRQAVIAINTDRVLSETTYRRLDAAFEVALCGKASPASPSANGYSIRESVGGGS
ncbi:serine hydrolase domain-containing protein [Actinocorallia populi]|uniref:serine hydrolase domain-containing protein n=1 Tax=Actinocorallia populi TaxID=2079200 RepID=UPI000D092274|nr:serine hydrolase domain-containing protein [Actinocorallia populi]